MTTAEDGTLLGAVCDGWTRHNTALLNLLQSLPPGGLQARIFATSPTVAQMFSHVHHERMISVLENAPEHAGVVPSEEWLAEHDAQRIADNLRESHARVLAAVRGRTEEQRPLDREFAHPVHLLMFLIFHEGYHHGQIKSALKSIGAPLSDDVAGPLIWDAWRARSAL